MSLNSSPQRRAVFQALFVTFLWATSWVLIKIGLHDLPALTFAGMRYTLAFLCLLLVALRSPQISTLHRVSKREWLRLIVLGLLWYAAAQGAQFLALAYLPAVTVSLLLNFTSVIVAFLGIIFLGEVLSWLQWGGLALYLVGLAVYFLPISITEAQWIGVGIALVGVLTNAVSAVIARSVNRDTHLPPLIVTTVSMGAGSIALLVTAVITQGIPYLNGQSIAIIIWLAVVNTAFAFTVWNHVLRTLTAVQSSVIGSTVLIQVALLAWLFLGEQIDVKEAAGMLIVGVGIVLVQLRR